jgi:hypothetical protein
LALPFAFWCLSLGLLCPQAQAPQNKEGPLALPFSYTKKKTQVHLIISPLHSSSSSSSSSFCSWVVKDGFLTVDQGIGTARGASPGAKLVCKLITSVFLFNFVMSPKGR